MTVFYNGFEWEEDKNEANIKKHGIDFKDAIKIFDRPFIELYDFAHSTTNEDRYKNIGIIDNAVVLLVITTDRKNITRIISARKANKDEEAFFYERRYAFNSPNN